MKTLLVLALLTFSLKSFSQTKIPAVDINNPPESKPTMTVSTVEPVAPAAPAVAGPNGCTMNFANVKSLFIQDKKLFKEITPIELDANKQILKQGVIVANGIEIKLVRQGCKFDAFVLNITPLRVQNNQPQHLYRQALTLLTMKDMQYDRSEYASIAPLTKSLVRNNWDQIKAENGGYTLPCVNAKCTMKVIKVDGVDKQIELTYDTNPDLK